MMRTNVVEILDFWTSSKIYLYLSKKKKPSRFYSNPFLSGLVKGNLQKLAINIAL